MTYDELINRVIARETLREHNLAKKGDLGEWNHVWNPWYEGYHWYEGYIDIPYFNPGFYKDYGSVEDLNITKYINVTISRIEEIKAKFDHQL